MFAIMAILMHITNTDCSMKIHQMSIMIFCIIRGSYILNTRLFALPGRNSWGIGKKRLNDTLTKDTSEVLDMLVEKARFSVIGWDLEPQRIKNILTDPVVVYRAVKQKFKTMELFTPGHLVMLCHDQNFLREDEKNKLRTFIDLLQKDSDISLEFITDYPGVSVVTKI